MWRKAKKIYLFIILNVILIPAHVFAFQSPIPWLAWLSVALHIYVLMYFFVSTFFPNNKQSKNENR